MQNTVTNLMETLNIYTNLPISLDFFDSITENSESFQIVHKSLSALQFSQKDHITIAIVDDLAELQAITIGCKYTLAIIAQNTLPDDLPDVMLYQQSADENHQQALEKVIHYLVKFHYLVGFLFIEPADIFESDAFQNGQHYIHLHCFQKQQLFNDDVIALLNHIGKNGTAIILNFMASPSTTLGQFQDLTKNVDKYLGENFDNEFYLGFNHTLEPEQQNLLYLSYLST